jgi:hypothetical protein
VREMVAVGFPAGNLLEAVRNRVVSRRETPTTMEERTTASGRWLQPGPLLAPVTWATALPLRALQRPFGQTTLGTGLVALAGR